MDRTIIETYRAEEKELSHLLCEKMKGLMLLQPAQEELRKHVHDEMFLKINHQGFFHVMAFLCRLYDPIEFRKRFLWPLTDKRSEANFRTSTIDYMKYLNEKYQLNWLNIKQYLVIMPGGMKFITFLLDFIKFIISEQIKQREKHFIAMELQEITNESIDDVVSEANIYSVLRKNICLKESSSDYLNALHDVNNILELKISVITEQLQEISNQTNFGINLLMSETFLEKFWSSIQLLYKERFLIKPLSVRNMEKPLEEFKLLLNEFHNKEINLTCNKNANKKEFLNNLKEYGTQKNLPQIKGIIDEYEVARRNDARWNEYVDVDDDDIDINLLMRIFNCIYKPLTMELSKINQKSQPSQFIVNKIDDLLVKLQQMKEQLNNFQKMIYSKSNNNNNLTVKSNQPQAETDAKHATCTPVKWQRKQHRRWNRMLLSTPPIIQNDFQEIEAAKCKRIRLIDMTIANSISSGSGSSNNNNNRNVNNGVKSQMDWLTSNFYERCHIKSTLPEVTIAHNQHRQSDDSDDESNINATIVDTRALLSSLKKANNDKSIKSGNLSDLYKDDNNDGDDGDDDNDDNLNCTIRTLGGKEHLTACKSKSPTKLNRLQMRQQQQQQYSLLSPYSPNCHMTPKHSSHKRQQLQEQRRNSGNKGSAAARKLFARDTDMHNNDVRINLNISPSGHLKSPNDAEILKSFECHTNIIAATTTTATTTTLTPTLTSKPKICLNNITIKDNDTNDIDHNRHHQHHLNEQTLNSSQDQELSNDNNNLGDINDLFNTSDTVLKVVTP